MQDQLTTLEKSVLQQVVSGDDMDAKRLRIQIAMLSIESRVYTDAGFTTCFSLPSFVPALSKDFDGNQEKIYADHPQVPVGAGFFLQSKHGKITSLSGYVFVGNWPVNESEFRVLSPDSQLNYTTVAIQQTNI